MPDGKDIFVAVFPFTGILFCAVGFFHSVVGSALATPRFRKPSRAVAISGCLSLVLSFSSLGTGLGGNLAGVLGLVSVASYGLLSVLGAADLVFESYKEHRGFRWLETLATGAFAFVLLTMIR
jgi:hypothetical protein